MALSHGSEHSRARVLDALAEFGLDRIEAGLARAYLDDLGVGVPANRFLADLIDSVAAADARLIARELVDRESPSLVDILRVFELSVPEADRELNGVYYTPGSIVEYIVAETVGQGDRVCDPACGGGAFLLEATDRLYRTTDRPVVDLLEAHVYGADLFANNVRQSKILLLLYALSRGEDPEYVEFNLVEADSLRLDWGETFPAVESGGFDAVVGNPPYVRIQHQSAPTKEYLLDAYETVESGNFNTYIPFVELAVQLVSTDGSVGYITPLNYFTTLTARDLRAFLQENAYVRKIVDFGELLLFEDANTYTAITFLDQHRKGQFEYVRVPDKSAVDALADLEPITINYSSLDPEKWRLLDDPAYEAINTIESYRPLDRIADIHTGVATLKDEVYTLVAEERNGEYYTIPFDGEEYRVERDLCRELVKISAVSDPSALVDNRRRIICPYRTADRADSGVAKTHRVEHEVIPPEDLAATYPRAHEYFEAARDVLATRENGAGADYEPWYKYGRKQGIGFVGERLYTPTFSDGPQFVYHDSEGALFANGYAVFPREENAAVLDAVLNSGVMDYYMRKTSKDIRGDYQCYQKNFLRRFSVPTFTPEEREHLRSASDERVDAFLAEKYGLHIELS